MTKKIYCYVDESGQDTEGQLFVVSVVLTFEETEQCRQLCEHIERQTGKFTKWIKTADSIQSAYIKQVLESPLLSGKLSFGVYKQTKEYLACTIHTIAHALMATGEHDYKAVVLIDALPSRLETAVSNGLHNWNIRTRKVKGIRKEDQDAIMRLADAICGLVRDAYREKPTMKKLLVWGLQTGSLKEISQK